MIVQLLQYPEKSKIAICVNVASASNSKRIYQDAPLNSLGFSLGFCPISPNCLQPILGMFILEPFVVEMTSNFKDTERAPDRGVVLLEISSYTFSWHHLLERSWKRVQDKNFPVPTLHWKISASKLLLVYSLKWKCYLDRERGLATVFHPCIVLLFC